MRSVYGKRGASSLHALVETLGRRRERIKPGAASPQLPALVRPLDIAALIGEDDEQTADVEERANALPSKDARAEMAALDDLRGRIQTLLPDPFFVPAKWQRVAADILAAHSIAPRPR